jgi:hypothetical protein
MKILDRAKQMKDEAMNARLSSGLERAERDRDRLKIENEGLRARVSHADEERSRLLESLEALTQHDTHDEPGATPKRHRIRGAMLLITAAGSAYVVGSKAGRERYEQIRRGWMDLRDKLRNRGEHDEEWEAQAPSSVLSPPTSARATGA